MRDSDGELVVIINVHTELLTTLAIASAARLHRRILVVNCGANATSSAHFENLAELIEFDLIDAPVRQHGLTLDWLFREVVDGNVLLLDSDAEIRQPQIIDRMWKSFRARGDVFGAGWTNGPGWLGGSQERRLGWYQERAWLPCVVFRSSRVKAALEAGLSFCPTILYNEVSFSRGLSRFMARRLQDPYTPTTRGMAHVPEWLRDRLDVRLDSLAALRGNQYGQRPHYVIEDTGCRIYQWCKYEEDLLFDGRDLRLKGEAVVHFGGMTRSALGDTGSHIDRLDGIETIARDRLLDVHGIDWISLTG